MEIDPFSRNTPESSSEDKTDDESSSKKKKKSKRSPLFNSGNSEEKDKDTTTSEQAEAKKPEASAEPLWRRILGQPEDEKEATEAENEHATGAEQSTEFDVEAGVEQSEAAELEYLSEEERLAVAQAYIDARQAELLQEQAEASEADNEQLVAERAADISLLENMRRFLRRDNTGQEQADEPIDHAFEVTVDQLGFTPPVTAETQAESPASTPDVMPLPSELALRRERQPDAEPETSTADLPNYAITTRETVSERATESYQSDYDTKRKTGSALLVGGLVGYAIGRRRGRIKTEKRLKAVEQKLTKQVESVQQVLVQKEQQIRNLARENYAAKAASEVRPLKREAAPKIEKKPLAPTELLGLVTVKAAEAPRGTRSPEIPKPSAVPEKIPSVTLQNATPEKPKPVAALSRSELLISAAEVTVGATNLRRVFETNLISEQGLRRLLEVNERGGNVRESLEREIVEKEMSYERDPRLRNRAVVGSLAASQVVRADIDRPTPPALVLKADADALAGNGVAATYADKQKAHIQKTAAAAVVTLLVVIAVLLVILFNSR